MNKYDTDQQCEEIRGTFASEPANEDNLTPEQEFDILFGYAEERHRNDPCAHPAPYDGCEGQWPGDGSGMDDLADMMNNEGGDW